MNQRQRKAHLSRGRGRHWPKRCSEYCAGCLVCEAWRFYDETGRFPTSDEAIAAADGAMKQVDIAEEAVIRCTKV